MDSEQDVLDLQYYISMREIILVGPGDRHRAKLTIHSEIVRRLVVAVRWLGDVRKILESYEKSPSKSLQIFGSRPESCSKRSQAEAEDVQRCWTFDSR